MGQVAEKYQGYAICQKTRRVERHNPASGHSWSEDVPLAGFEVYGPFAVSSHAFRTTRVARECVDFLVKYPMSGGVA